MAKHKSYTPKQLDDAVACVLAGQKIPAAATEHDIPYRTLFDHVKLAEAGERKAPARPGPRPLLPEEAEANIFEWLIARQQVGHPVDRSQIIRRASEIASLMYDKVLSDGWYTRFMDRHPALSVRVAQTINKARNNVDEAQVDALFQTLEKLLTSKQLDATRIFNVDETAFQSRNKSSSVVAVRGSTNVWKTEVTTGFHMSVVACGSASGLVVPPTFIFPDKSVDVTILEKDTSGARVTTTDSGFMNKWLFIRWLKFFSEVVPASIQRPVVLILDGCSSHISTEVIDMAAEQEILPVCLPANATHLFQPLDVAVFGAFKTKLRKAIENFIDDDDNYSIDKKTAVEIASFAWNHCNFSKNIIAGFKGCGLFPLSYEKMKECLAEFKRNGLPKDVVQPTWLQVKSVVQDSILVLPPPRRQPKRLKRVSPGGRLLDRQYLDEVAAAEAAKKAEKKQTNKRQRAQPTQARLSKCKKRASTVECSTRERDVAGAAATTATCTAVSASSCPAADTSSRVAPYIVEEALV